MSRRNTRQGKARRRAERERRRDSTTSGQEPEAVEAQAGDVVRTPVAGGLRWLRSASQAHQRREMHH